MTTLLTGCHHIQASRKLFVLRSFDKNALQANACREKRFITSYPAAMLCVGAHMLHFTVAQLALCKGLEGSLLPAPRGKAGMRPFRGPYPVAPKVFAPIQVGLTQSCAWTHTCYRRLHSTRYRNIAIEIGVECRRI